MRKILSGLSSSFMAKRRGNIGMKGTFQLPLIDSALRRKFFVSHLMRILIPCFIPLFILGTLTIVITNQYIRYNVEQSNANQLNQLNELAQVISSELDSLSLSFDKDPKITLKLKSLLSAPSFSYEDMEALFYLKNVLDVPANSKPFIHSISVYYENPYNRVLSSRDGLTQINRSDDTSWFERYNDLRSRKEEMITEVRKIDAYGFDHQSNHLVTIYKPFSYGYPGYHKGLIIMNVLPSYFEALFDYFNELPGRYFYIADKDGEPIMKSSGFTQYIPLPLREGSQDGNASLSRFEYADNLINVKQVPRLQWNLISVVPKDSLYSLPRTIVYMTVILSLFSLLLSSVYALWITRRNYRQIVQIASILESADRPAQPMPDIPSKINDVYEWIIKSILETFLEHKYVKIQLSERKAKMELLELKALQSQMNPHFLYNTLHSIYWKTLQLTGGPNDACRMIEQLSDLMEYAVRSKDDLVPLSMEIAHVQSFIDIQHSRFPGRFDVLWDIQEGAEACHVIKISLQPLIENSIHYGLESREFLRIKVKCRLKGNSLQVTILDNGMGNRRSGLSKSAHPSCQSRCSPIMSDFLTRASGYPCSTDQLRCCASLASPGAPRASLLRTHRPSRLTMQ
ncbi:MULTISPECIES: sensor histidine kinase [unclassified Paenibacillus]|uniref:sensor histidine kinase n=1 Tax=unclassified Paenibacillus TaxID=185978 RepID=UPI0036383600